MQGVAVKFLVATHASTDADGKINVWGLFPTGEIRTLSTPSKDRPEITETVLPALALVTILENVPNGRYEAIGALVGPTGEYVIPEGSNLGEVDAGDSGAFCHILNLNPFPVPRFGKYRYAIEVAGQRSEHDITILSDTL